MAGERRGFLADFLKEEDGATASEYAVMMALVLAVVFATVLVLGKKIDKAFNDFVVLYESSTN